MPPLFYVRVTQCGNCAPLTAGRSSREMHDSAPPPRQGRSEVVVDRELAAGRPCRREAVAVVRAGPRLHLTGRSDRSAGPAWQRMIGGARNCPFLKVVSALDVRVGRRSRRAVADRAARPLVVPVVGRRRRHDAEERERPSPTTGGATGSSRSSWDAEVDSGASCPCSFRSGLAVGHGLERGRSLGSVSRSAARSKAGAWSRCRSRLVLGPWSLAVRNLSWRRTPASSNAAACPRRSGPCVGQRPAPGSCWGWPACSSGGEAGVELACVDAPRRAARERPRAPSRLLLHRCVVRGACTLRRAPCRSVPSTRASWGTRRCP